MQKYRQQKNTGSLQTADSEKWNYREKKTYMVRSRGKDGR